MKRNFLEELGLEKEVIDKIMDANGADIEKAKGSLTDVQAERDELKKLVAERDKQLEDLKKATGDADEFKKQIEQLQADNKSIRIDAAIDKALTGAKAKNLVAVKALLKDMDKAELLEDGTIKGLDEQIKALQKDADYLFASKEKPDIKGAAPAEPGDDKPKGITREQFNRMGYKERVKLAESDPDTYKTLVGAE